MQYKMVLNHAKFTSGVEGRKLLIFKISRLGIEVNPEKI